MLGRELRMAATRPGAELMTWSSALNDGCPFIDAAWDGSTWHVHMTSIAPAPRWSIRGSGPSIDEAIAAMPVCNPERLAGGAA